MQKTKSILNRTWDLGTYQISYKPDGLIPNSIVQINLFTQMKDGFDAGKKKLFTLFQHPKLKQQISSLQIHSKWLIPQNRLSNAGRPLWSVIAKSKKITKSFSFENSRNQNKFMKICLSKGKTWWFCCWLHCDKLRCWYFNLIAPQITH